MSFVKLLIFNRFLTVEDTAHSSTTNNLSLMTLWWRQKFELTSLFNKQHSANLGLYLLFCGQLLYKHREYSSAKVLFSWGYYISQEGKHLIISMLLLWWHLVVQYKSQEKAAILLPHPCTFFKAGTTYLVCHCNITTTNWQGPNRVYK